MVSVSNISPVPRLSIVVPISRDLAAFESTLISVLENRPRDCEVLVTHDGSYDDPFNLCDEVRFVIADSAALVDLVSAATLGRELDLCMCWPTGSERRRAGPRRLWRSSSTLTLESWPP